MEYGDTVLVAPVMSAEPTRSIDRHRSRVDCAAGRGHNPATRAAGEVLVDAVIASLATEGWSLLHDRVMPSGGSVSHLVVGPASVIVLAAKAWKGELEVRGDQLFNGRWSQRRVLETLAAQRAAVRSALGEVIRPDDPVDTALVVTTQPDFAPVRVGGTTVLGIGHLREGIRSSRTSFSPSQVETMNAILMSAFPSIGEASPVVKGLQQVDGVEIGELFDRANRFLFIDQWALGRRVYIRDEDGEQYGYKDLDGGSIHLDHAGDVLVEAVLAASNPCGVDLAMLRVPRQPIGVPGGPLLSLLGKIHTTVIVGSLWRSGTRRWLHGTLAGPSEGPFNLGYVDLATGELHPAWKGQVSRSRGSAERYLALLRDRQPFDRRF